MDGWMDEGRKEGPVCSYHVIRGALCSTLEVRIRTRMGDNILPPITYLIGLSLVSKKDLKLALLIWTVM